MTVTITRQAPPAMITGMTAVASYGFAKCYNTESGVVIDRTSEFQDGATPVESFAAVDDYIYLGATATKVGKDTATTYDGRFLHIYINLDTVASSSITPVFEYNNGNAWVEFGAIIDGTNGFTQNGTIEVGIDNIPSYAAWVKGSQDGAGNEIGDSVDRCYMRIKRTATTVTTLPKFSEVGTGELTANKTYYYKGVAMANGVYQNDSQHHTDRLSTPSSELSATTTDYKRSVYLAWTGDSLYHLFWRTATSGNYQNAGRTAAYNSEIDTYCQTVRSRANFYYRSTSTTSTVDLMDTGLIPTFGKYTSTLPYRVRTYYGSFYFKDHSIAEIKVSGGDSTTPAKLMDIYKDNVAGGFDDFIPITPNDDKVYYNSWNCYSHLIIDENFKDDSFNLFIHGYFLSYTTSDITFGLKNDYTDAAGKPAYYTRNGGNITMVADATDWHTQSFYNVKFYGSTLRTGIICTNLERSYAYYYFYEDCEFVDTILDSGGLIGYERFKFYCSTNLYIRNLNIVGSRFGLYFSEDSWAGDMEGITFTSKVMFDGAALLEGDTIVRDWTFLYGSSWFSSCYLSSSNAERVVNLYLVNPTIQVRVNGTLAKARVGINYTYFEQFTLELDIKDKYGVAIEDASVIINDGTANIYDDVTDSDGSIPRQDITFNKYSAGTPYSSRYYNYYADDVTNYPLHTVTISKLGYETEVLKFPMSQKMVMSVTLKPAIDSMVVLGKGVVIRVDPTNNTKDRDLIIF